MPNKTSRLHLFTSVKGGSAKTSTALLYAHELSLRYEHKDKNGETIFPKVIVIDADVRGTSMETVLLGKQKDVGIEYLNEGDVDTDSTEYSIRDNKYSFDDYGSRRYYTNAIIGLRMSSELVWEDGFITYVAAMKDATDTTAQEFELEINEAEENDMTNDDEPLLDTLEPEQNVIDQQGAFYVALANQNQGSKDRFGTDVASRDGAAVSTMYFQTCFKTLLDSLDKMSLNDDGGYLGFDFILIDMSPGHDEYVRCIIELCLSKYTDKKVTSERLKEHRDYKEERLLNTWEPTIHSMTLPTEQHFYPALNHLLAIIGSTRLTTNHMNRINLTVVDSYNYAKIPEETNQRSDEQITKELHKLVYTYLLGDYGILRSISIQRRNSIVMKLRTIPYIEAFGSLTLPVFDIANTGGVLKKSIDSVLRMFSGLGEHTDSKVIKQLGGDYYFDTDLVASIIPYTVCVYCVKMTSSIERLNPEWDSNNSPIITLRNNDGEECELIENALSSDKKINMHTFHLTSSEFDVFKVFYNGNDTGAEINEYEQNITLNFLTIFFRLNDTTESSCCTINAFYNDIEIESGDIVLGTRNFEIIIKCLNIEEYKLTWTGIPEGTSVKNDNSLRVSIDRLRRSLDVEIIVEKIDTSESRDNESGGDVND
ncbi:MAG: hypothetical protein FWG88_10035 [Oscillospiraceae bacterium]|nr:hypothetical protein [Oscillospiraceae bacterium]